MERTILSRPRSGRVHEPLWGDDMRGEQQETTRVFGSAWSYPGSLKGCRVDHTWNATLETARPQPNRVQLAVPAPHNEPSGDRTGAAGHAPRVVAREIPPGDGVAELMLVSREE